MVDPHAERAQQIVDGHGGKPYASLAEALAGAEVDIVVRLHPDRHARPGRHRGAAGGQGRDHREAGGDHRRASTDEIIAAQQAAGRLVTVISQHRFDPATEVTVDAIAAGELGRLTSGIASIDWWRGQSYYDSGDWRGTWELDGGGALMNQGVHTVDLLVATMGRPVEVFAYTGTLAHERIEVEDVAVGVVRFDSGALGVLHATTAAYPGLSARLQVHGDQGSVIIDSDELSFIHRTPSDDDRRASGRTGSRTTTRSTRSRSSPRPRARAAAPAPIPGQLGSDAHRRQYENFLAALDGDEELRVDLQTNRQAIAIITGVYESARTGRPVRLT